MTAERTTVLGLCSFTHDSAAALIADSTLVGFVEEERLSGDKHTSAYPTHAVEWLLDAAGVDATAVDVVAYNFDGDRYLDVDDGSGGNRATARVASFHTVHIRFVERMAELRRRFPRAEIRPVLHHRAHGLYAFASSPYESAAVLVVDSLGEMQTTTLGRARRDGSGCDLHIQQEILDPASLGYAYGAVTQHLGWRRGDGEGTVMALAALGDPARFRTLMQDAIPITRTGFALNGGWFPVRVLSRDFPRISEQFTAATCPPRRPEDALEPVHADLAAALQERTEQVMVHLARRARELTGSGLLCVGGGVAANCVAIGRIVDEGLFDGVHVPPAPGDSGTAIGAALAASLDVTGVLPEAIRGECYLGPAYPDPTRAIAEAGLTSNRPENPAGFLARRLADGAVVGLFQGRIEAGPRALGNRSILASPLRPDVVDRLNRTVKFREPFRPFAPVVLASAAGDYFTLPQPSPYMSVASGVTELTRSSLPSVVHVNGTGRLQTVTAASNPFLADVLREFSAITGHPVLINTSLNVKGRPICGTPAMALDCLTGSGLDALMLEGHWVESC